MKEITLSNVLFGDVWFCGGQSNMQFTLSQVCFLRDSEMSSALIWRFRLTVRKIFKNVV